MYEKYWDLACRPFDNPFSASFFFRSDTHESAHLKLRYAVENGLGLAVLSGGIGTGKTAVAAFLQYNLSEAFSPFIHLVFPQMPAPEFLSYIAAKLGAEDRLAGRRGLDRTLRLIENRLRGFCEQGCRPTLVVDEAHLIDDVRVFECLQLLLNFQQDAACSFALVLVGGPTLLGRLERMPQLNDRVAVRSVIEPLSHEETLRYIAQRLLAAGAQRDIFLPSALDAIWERSGGIPRRINRLGDLALLVGYADQLKTVGLDEIHAAAEELPAAIAA